MERKPQQQTLSIRISDTLREFLERSKQVLSSGRGESVSTSDVAKILLESAKDDQLDSRLEVADLQQSPTESLWAMRKKWEAKQALSRAEWIFSGQYIQIASEAITENPAMPGPQSFIVLLQALLAVRSLRTHQDDGLDLYYLENLGMPEGAASNEGQLSPDVVRLCPTLWPSAVFSNPTQPHCFGLPRAATGFASAGQYASGRTGGTYRTTFPRSRPLDSA